MFVDFTEGMVELVQTAYGVVNKDENKRRTEGRNRQANA